jgi:3-oxoadipate enol-lactonase
MKSHFFTTKSGYQIHYQTVDNILPASTVFIHGNVASNRWWLPTEEVFSAEAKGKNVTGTMICVEFLGCGKSEVPKNAEDVNVIQFAHDFNDLLADLNHKTGRNEKFNLVGHSTGGFIAAAMTALQTNLFNKSVLLDPVGAKGLTLDDNIKAGFEAMKADRNISALAIGATIYNNDATTDYFNQVIVEDTFTAVKNISYWVVQAFHKIDATALMSQSITPTLVLHGEHDNLLSRQDSEELAIKYLKNGKFEIVPNHGHCMNIENPKNFVKKISSFLF